MSPVLVPEASSSVTADLTEDTLAAWAPDVAGWVDLPHYDAEVSPTTTYVAHRLAVPRPGGGLSDVRVLHPGWHVALHRAVLPLRDPADHVLAPGVFGYRMGAMANRRYADDWRRFCRFVAEQAEMAEYIVVSDVKSFFASTPWRLALSNARPLLDERRFQVLVDAAAGLDRGDVTCLPTGYADARLLANLVLAPAEAQLDVPFARWVDDYRLFVRDPEHARYAISVLDAGLQSVCLHRNSQKTRVMLARDAMERHHQTLASVYHPERDVPEIVASRLREVFRHAADDPLANRRQLRFVLPRLAEQQDASAIPCAIRWLRELPWEAPRLVGYLAAFADGSDLAPAVNGVLLEAVRARDAWLVARLAPLIAKIGLSAGVASELERSHDIFLGTPCWGLVLRLLALDGRLAATRRALEDYGGDARAVIVAARDLDLTLPRRLREAEPVLATVLEGRQAPALEAKSLL